MFEDIFNSGLTNLAVLAARAPAATNDPPPVTGANAAPAIPPAIDKPTSVTNLKKVGLFKKLSVSLLYLPFSASVRISSGETISSNSLSKLKEVFCCLPER